MNTDCQIVINISNAGPGNLPDEVWADNLVELEIMSDEMELLESVKLSVMDPEKNLKYPGGGAKYTSDVQFMDERTEPLEEIEQSEEMEPTEHTVRLVIDSKNLVKEMSDGNNIVERTIKCEVGF